MKVSDRQPQLLGSVKEPLAPGAQRDSFAIYVALSAAVHAAVILVVLGGAWLWRTPTYYKPPLYTVSLVDAPLTLRQPTSPVGGEKPSEKPGAAGDQQPAAPAESAPKPASAESVKVIPAEPVPKAPPPAPKAVAEPQEKKPEPKEAKKQVPEEPKKPEPAEPKKPALEEPKKPVVSPPMQRPSAPTQAQPPPSATSMEARQAVDKLRERQAQAQPPPPPSATSTEARQAVDKLRERQTQEAKVQSEAAQTQQRTAEERLAALRARYGGGGAEGSGTGGGGAAGPLSDLQRIRMQAYQERVYELIRAAWILPMPREEAHKLQATALLTVSRDGQITRFQLLKASGNPLFDESLLRAIKQTDPLPPLPGDYQGEFLEVELRFRPRES